MSKKRSQEKIPVEDSPLEESPPLEEVEEIDYQKYIGWQKPPVFIAVEGSASGEKLHAPNQNELDVLLKYSKGHTEREGSLIFWIDKTKAVFKKSFKSVACCAYNATDDFIQAMLGGKLHNTDREWYTSHPWTEGPGLPYHATLTVLNDLVRPYGFGVSRAAIVKNQALPPEVKKWVPVLGINPVGELDGKTSNRVYLDLIAPHEGNLRDQTWAQIQNDFRLEFIERHELTGAAVCCAGTNGGGHASYKPPRGTDNREWLIAVKFDRIERIPYHSKPPSSEDGDHIDSLELDWRESLAYEGVKFREALSSWWKENSPNRGPFWTTPYGRKEGETSAEDSSPLFGSGRILSSAANGGKYGGVGEENKRSVRDLLEEGEETTTQESTKEVQERFQGQKNVGFSTISTDAARFRRVLNQSLGIPWTMVLTEVQTAINYDLMDDCLDEFHNTFKHYNLLEIFTFIKDSNGEIKGDAPLVGKIKDLSHDVISFVNSYYDSLTLGEIYWLYISIPTAMASADKDALEWLSKEILEVFKQKMESSENPRATSCR